MKDEKKKKDAELSWRGFFKTVGVTAAGVGASAIAARLAGIGTVGLGTMGSVLSAKAAGPGTKYDTPTISCPATPDDNTIELTVCAGASGAPAGFSIQWMTCADYAANGKAWYASDDDRLCKASFSGNANRTNWNLGPGACINVVIGGLNDADPGVSFTCNDPLECETCYVFRVFAHANSSKNRSVLERTLRHGPLGPCP